MSPDNWECGIVLNKYVIYSWDEIFFNVLPEKGNPVSLPFSHVLAGVQRGGALAPQFMFETGILTIFNIGIFSMEIFFQCPRKKERSFQWKYFFRLGENVKEMQIELIG
ncbi:unnamed protein product [Cuscuta epithymum]|uniref:Uncharacterized protein n=1 Tax=Cuscuta epithymum TaxID=186058 RepID=A0AAV0G2D1_9ASTE|nr:unnamed protein product [Cuscuta epithymum]CAH9142100.1 unnamed protein product [Cuscuta epithymum]